MIPENSKLIELYGNCKNYCIDFNKCFKKWDNCIVYLCNCKSSLEFCFKSSELLQSQSIRNHLIICKNPKKMIIIDCVVDNKIFSFERGKIVTVECYRRKGYDFLYASGFSPSEEWRSLQRFNY